MTSENQQNETGRKLHSPLLSKCSSDEESASSSRDGSIERSKTSFGGISLQSDQIQKPQPAFLLENNGNEFGRLGKRNKMQENIKLRRSRSYDEGKFLFDLDSGLKTSSLRDEKKSYLHHLIANSPHALNEESRSCHSKSRQNNSVENDCDKHICIGVQNILSNPGYRYEGNPAAFWSWKSRLQKKIILAGLSPKYSFLAIQANTNKRPRKLVDFILKYHESDPVEAVSIIWRVLSQQFGDANYFAEQLISELNNFPAIDSVKSFFALENFLDLCWKIYLNLPHCPKLNEMNTSSAVKQLQQKLPVELQRQWLDASEEYELVIGEEPKLITFLSFLHDRVKGFFDRKEEASIKCEICKSCNVGNIEKSQCFSPHLCNTSPVAPFIASETPCFSHDIGSCRRSCEISSITENKCCHCNYGRKGSFDNRCQHCIATSYNFQSTTTCQPSPLTSGLNPDHFLTSEHNMGFRKAYQPSVGFQHFSSCHHQPHKTNMKRPKWTTFPPPPPVPPLIPRYGMHEPPPRPPKPSKKRLPPPPQLKLSKLTTQSVQMSDLKDLGHGMPDDVGSYDVPSPANSIVPAENTTDEKRLEDYEWYFGKISRQKAEDLLTEDENLPLGTFLVRKSENRHGYSISIKKPRPPSSVTHWAIAKKKNKYFLKPDMLFDSVQQLIEHYADEDTTYSLLQKPCPKASVLETTEKRLELEESDFNDRIDKSWKIGMDEISFTKLIGRGSFGEVWFGKWNNSEEVAIKKATKEIDGDITSLSEAIILTKLRHSNILRLYGVCVDNNRVMIVSEFMNRGSLLDILRQEGSGFKLADLVEICYQVAAGMAHIEEMAVIHRDLAARNVLVKDKNTYKIADFGLARITEDSVYNSTAECPFPVKWTAPEGILRNEFSIQSDVWSFGILMMEVVTLGATPYPGNKPDMPNREVIKRVPQGYRMSRPTDPVECPSDLYEIMCQCWQEKPQDRVTFQALSAAFKTYPLPKEDRSKKPEYYNFFIKPSTKTREEDIYSPVDTYFQKKEREAATYEYHDYYHGFSTHYWPSTSPRGAQPTRENKNRKKKINITLKSLFK